MLDAISQATPLPFEVLICQAPDRFSRRDGDESFAELKAIAKRGVQIWFYGDGTRFQFGDFASNTLGFLKGEFAAEYRRAISVKTAEAMIRKARAGHVTGGRVFGYDNLAVDQHVERRINESEAAVIRRIFEQCALGVGYTRTAKRLNAEGACCPRPTRPPRRVESEHRPRRPAQSALSRRAGLEQDQKARCQRRRRAKAPSGR